MPNKIIKQRQFEVHSKQHERMTARVLEESSLEAAAVAFVEEVGASLHAPDEHTVTVYVRDLAGGVEHCVCIDLDTGQTKPCD